jgi:hypothetical protein
VCRRNRKRRRVVNWNWRRRRKAKIVVDVHRRRIGERGRGRDETRVVHRRGKIIKFGGHSFILENSQRPKGKKKGERGMKE